MANKNSISSKSEAIKSVQRGITQPGNSRKVPVAKFKLKWNNNIGKKKQAEKNNQADDLLNAATLTPEQQKQISRKMRNDPQSAETSYKQDPAERLKYLRQHPNSKITSDDAKLLQDSHVAPPNYKQDPAERLKYLRQHPNERMSLDDTRLLQDNLLSRKQDPAKKLEYLKEHPNERMSLDDTRLLQDDLLSRKQDPAKKLEYLKEHPNERMSLDDTKLLQDDLLSRKQDPANDLEHGENPFKEEGAPAASEHDLAARREFESQQQRQPLNMLAGSQFNASPETAGSTDDKNLGDSTVIDDQNRQRQAAQQLQQSKMQQQEASQKEKEAEEQAQAGGQQQKSGMGWATFTLCLGLSVLKDLVDILGVGWVGVVVNIIVYPSMFLLLFASGMGMKEFLKKRKVVILAAPLLEFIPFLSILPIWTLTIIYAKFQSSAIGQVVEGKAKTVLNAKKQISETVKEATEQVDNSKQ